MLLASFCTLKKERRPALTDGGKRIEAVVATHPFHTLAFRRGPGPFAVFLPLILRVAGAPACSFYGHYPTPKYYGTPRHLRNFTDIPWAGDVNCPTVRSLWAPAIDMRIPAGAEFVDPKPEKSVQACGRAKHLPRSKGCMYVCARGRCGCVCVRVGAWMDGCVCACVRVFGWLTGLAQTISVTCLCSTETAEPSTTTTPSSMPSTQASC